LTHDTQSAVKVKGQEVKGRGHSVIQRVQKFAKLSIIHPGWLDFAQILYRLWSGDAGCTTNFQGQQVKGQGHSVT